MNKVERTNSNSFDKLKKNVTLIYLKIKTMMKITITTIFSCFCKIEIEKTPKIESKKKIEKIKKN